MFRYIWQRILELFDKKQNVDDRRLNQNNRFTLEYEDTRDINFNSIFANKLANLTISDSNIDIIGDDNRTKLLKDTLKRLKRKLKRIVARGLGTGGVLVIPYVANNKIYFNIVSQNRLIINKTLGEDIIDCTIMADHIVKDKEHYYRFADYTLLNGNLIIKYRATKDNMPIDMKSIEQWSLIKDVAISNVSKMPFMFIKSPIDNRRENDDYGVPITYGCEKQINEIKETLEQILREYKLKEAFVGADQTMFRGDGALPSNGLYRKINAGDDSFWEVFDPSIRDSSLYNKLMQQCALLEKQIGTSKGILTDRQSGNATATEIKASMKDTFDLVDDIRDSLTEGLNDFLTACNVLANYYNLSAQGDFELSCDWSYSMIEDNQTIFSQMIQGVNQGVIKKAELRQYIKPEETLEQAQEVIDEIKKQNPTTKDLLGE